MLQPLTLIVLGLALIGDGFSGRLIECQPTGDGTAQTAADNQDADATQLAKAVCADKKVKMQSVHGMMAIIAAIQQEDRMCRDRYLSAIYELQPLLELKSDQLCKEEALDKIKAYHFRFIQPKKQANRRPTQFEPLPRDLVKGQLHPEPRKYTVDFDEHDQVLLAPISFRHFFLKFALQVSYQCKKNLMMNLRADAERLLSDKDREVMAMFGGDSPIGAALASGGALDSIDFDSVLYIPELDGRRHTEDGELEQATGSREQHLRTNARENSALYQMIYACKNKFKPMYDKLILPIVQLSKLGYDYQGEKGFTERERDFLAGGEMKNWLVLVHVCEIFKKTILISADDEQHSPEDASEKRTLREELNDAEHDKDGDEGDDDGTLVQISEQKAEELERHAKFVEMFKPLDYEPTVESELGDKLMIESERELDLELSRKQGHKNPFGFRGLLRRAAGALRRQLAKLDLMKFAHYRRNSLLYSGLLNFISSCSNVASITITIMSSAGYVFG